MDNQTMQYEENANLCRHCKRRTIDRSENPDSILCKDCREELIKLRIPQKPFVIVSVVTCLVVFILIFSVNVVKSYSIYNSYNSDNSDNSYHNAEQIAADGYPATAIENLMTQLDEGIETETVAVELADIAMSYAYYDYAAYAIDEYLVGKELSAGVYDRMTRYVEELDRYYTTADLSELIWAETIDMATSAEEASTLTEEYIERMSRYIGSSLYDQALVYYHMGYAAIDEEERVGYYEKCVEINPNYVEASAQIAVWYRSKGDLEKARELLEDAYRINKEQYEVLRAFATLELVEGNLEQGLEYAKQAYESYPEGFYVADTYIVALASVGRMEEAQKLASELEDEALSEDLHTFLNGEMTLEEYYIEK